MVPDPCGRYDGKIHHRCAVLDAAICRPWLSQANLIFRPIRQYLAQVFQVQNGHQKYLVEEKGESEWSIVACTLAQ